MLQTLDFIHKSSKIRQNLSQNAQKLWSGALLEAPWAHVGPQRRQDELWEAPWARFGFVLGSQGSIWGAFGAPWMPQNEPKELQRVPRWGQNEVKKRTWKHFMRVWLQKRNIL